MKGFVPLAALFVSTTALAEEGEAPLALSTHVSPELPELSLWILEESSGEGTLTHDTCTVETSAGQLDCELMGTHSALITALSDGYQVTVAVDGMSADYPDAFVISLGEGSTETASLSIIGDLLDWIHGAPGVTRDCVFFYNVSLNVCEDMRSGTEVDWEAYEDCWRTANSTYQRCREAVSGG